MSSFSRHPRLRKIAGGFLVFFFMLQIHAGLFLFVRPANAIPVGVVASVPDAVKTVMEKIKEAIEKGFQVSFTQMLNRALITFTANVAQRAAEGLAEGGTGGKPLFKTSDLKDAMKDAKDGAVGDLVDEFARGTIGLSVCSPPDLRLNISLKLLEEITPPKPRCSFKNMQEQWGELTKEGGLFNRPDFARYLAIGLNPVETEVGQSLDAIINAEAQRGLAQERSLTEALISPFNPVVNTVAKTIKTPVSLVETYGDETLIKKNADNTAEIFKPTGDIWTDSVKVGAGVFITTFTNRYFQRLLTGLFNPQKQQRNISLPGGGATTTGGDFRTSSSVTAFSIGTSGGEYDVLADFTTCPEDVAARSIYNCVIDQGFAEAVRAGMSVYEAMYPDPSKRKEPLLHPDWSFGFWGPDAKSEPLYNLGYSYSNMKKLRRMRIVPVGWELAAAVVRDKPKANTTLADVVDGFDKPGSDFYGLVDPNWILKSPLLNCRLKAPSQLLSPGTDNRQELCVDIQDCAVTNDDGTGCKAWGYCTRERNTWRFPGTSCPAQFNTCQQFTRERDGQTFAYLKNTINFCDPNAAGCTRYSATKNSTQGQWTNAELRFFNKNAQSCNNDAVGCTQFLTVTGTDAQGNRLDLTKTRFEAVRDAKPAEDTTKTAKDYYAKDDVTVQPVHLKGTRLDCRGTDGAAEEANVGCELYASESNDPEIPAIVGAGDRCPAACVGYDAYKEVPTAFDSQGRFPLYLIPQRAKSCSADAAGCEEFTNLDAATNRGEAKQYFTALRQCQKPQTDSKTYFTWTGSETSGYQLQTHSLKASDADSGKAPCTVRRLFDNECIDKDNPTLVAACTPAETKTNSDCREFYDENGNISYRLYSRTIISDERCVRYRKTTFEDDARCIATGGMVENGACIYLTFPPENRSCPAAAVGCREYKGNTANDTRLVVDQNFEPGVSAPAGWSGDVDGQITLQSGGHSIRSKANAAGVGQRIDVKLNKDDVRNDRRVYEKRTYLLSFIARGAGKLLPFFSGDTTAGKFAENLLTTSKEKLALEPNWKLFNLGPVVTTWKPNETTESLVFENVDGEFWIDNVQLKEVRDDFFLIKNSWTTPSDPNGCETNPNDGREAGCRAYTDRAGTRITAKSFARLCRQEFVGCKAMVNTQNSSWPGEKPFNNTNKDASGSLITSDNVTVVKDTLEYFVDDPAQYCASDQKGCKSLGEPSNPDRFTVFPVRICKSPDAARNNASCATAAEEAACKASNGACQDTTTRYLKDDPDTYGQILCTEPNVGCDVYKSTGGGPAYFKNPGNKTCKWRQIPGTTGFLYGWFRSETSEEERVPDCSTLVPEHPPLLDGSDTPRFDPANPTGQVAANDTKYPRHTRICTPAADRCTAFVDPQDKSSSFYPKGRPYFVVDDDSLREGGRRDCNGLVGQKEGCVLFRNEGKFKSDGSVDLIYSSNKTLDNNIEKKKPVDPARCADDPNPQNCDTNELLKVNRDRTCGEWLTCTSGVQVYDKKSQSLRDVCYQVGACKEASLSNAGLCTKSVDAERDPKPFTPDIYKARGTGPGGSVLWRDSEYSGYSIPYMYPANTLRPIAQGTSTATGQAENFTLGAWGMIIEDGKPKTCTLENVNVCGIGARCVFSGTGSGSLQSGLCYAQRGMGVRQNGTALPVQGKSCRAFAKIDAPFPSSVVEAWHDTDEPPYTYRPKEKKQGFEQANVAQRFFVTVTTTDANGVVKTEQSTKSDAAQCSYQRVDYQDGTTLFYDLNQKNIESILYNDGIEPDPDTYKLRRISTEYGLNGYCLEEDGKTFINGGDIEHPCFTWFPVDLVQGEIDINNIAPESAYNVSPGKKFYCVETRDEEYHGAYGYSRCGTGAENYVGYEYASSRYGSCSKSHGTNTFGYNYLPSICYGGGWGGNGCADIKGGEKQTITINSEKQKECMRQGGTCGEGWYPTGAKDTRRVAERRRVCTKIALISEPLSNQNLGWTDRLIGRTSTTYKVPELDYDKTKLADPYGVTDAGVLDFTQSQLFAICDAGTENGKSCVGTEARRRCLEKGGTCGPLVVRPTVPHAGSPYTKSASETYSTATERLKNIFARGFGIWEWQGAVTACIKYCKNGMYQGTSTQCTTPANCPAHSTAQCVTDPAQTTRRLCDGGPNDGADCTTDTTLCNGAGQCDFLGGQCETGSAAYNPIASTLPPNFSWDFAGATNPITRGPEIRIPAYDGTAKTYSEGPNGISLDNVFGAGPDLEYNGDRPVTLKFYAYNANGEQMPLRRIIVDWGDGTEPTVNIGAFKNHKRECQRLCYNTKGEQVKQFVIKDGKFVMKDGVKVETTVSCSNNGFSDTTGTCGKNPDGTQNVCLSSNFGDTTDGCVQDSAGGAPGYFIFTHTYRCDQSAGNPHYKTDGKCHFKPKVQVLDNWGWCNGTCIAGKGCYDDVAKKPADLACSDANNAKYGNAWTPFDREIRLKPIIVQ